MKLRSAIITQSKFYSPVFNAAIFDGPLRIYLAQYQESYALNIYFLAQEKMKKYLDSKELNHSQYQNVFVMIYPSQEAFEMSFRAESQSQQDISVVPLEDDIVIGVNSQVEDKEQQQVAVVDCLEKTMARYEVSPPRVLEAVL